MNPLAVAEPIIRQVLETTRGQAEPAIRKALRLAYPFGRRPPAGDQYPYKVWLAEIRRQRGTSPRKTMSLALPRLPAPPPARPAAPLKRGPRAKRPRRPALTVAPAAPGARRRGRPPLPQPHVYSRQDLVVERVEHLPPPAEPRCRACGQLGELVSVTDMRGARRLRRRCAGNELGWTDIDWPACPHYQESSPR